MSKHTGDTRFRKIDVDSYNDDNYQDPEESGDGHGQTGMDINGIESQRRNGKVADALMLALSGSITSKNDALREKETECVVAVLSGFKTSEMDELVNRLDKNQVDLLMKFIYRGFSSKAADAGATAASLLTWHEKVFKVGGSGSIVRVITDRNK